jgi:biopolymer transport protein ExbB
MIPGLNADLLNRLSSLSTHIILAAFAVHLFVYFVLWIWYRRDLRSIASTLFDFTKGIKNPSLLDSNAHLSDQIDAFLADVKDVLDDGARMADRRQLLLRLQFLDERRNYLNSMWFETVYNIARTMIEAYPLSGVLGTILAIGASLQPDAAGKIATLNQIIERFGEGIWATFAGLLGAVILLFLNSFVEPSFDRLSENRKAVRETVARAKRELALVAPSDAGEHE